MDLVEFAKLVRDMRAAQNAYFHGGRTKSLLEASKALERRVDDACRSVLGLTTPGLFDPEPKRGA